MNRPPSVGVFFIFLACACAAARAQTNGEPAITPATLPMTQPMSPAGPLPEHIWTVEYAQLLWSDTGMVFTAPGRWGESDWMMFGAGATAVVGSAAFDRSIKDSVQAHRTSGQDKFMVQFQKLGSTWSFGVLGAFEVWGEATGDTTAKKTVMDGLAASLIGPGLMGTSLKEIFGRVRPNTATSTFEFRPFSGNHSLPSGHAFQAFAVATAIAENYHAWWVQVLCYGSAGLVGYARIEQNAHWTSDIVAGSLLGWSISRSIVHRHDELHPTALHWAPYTDGSRLGVVFFKSY